MGLVGAPGTTTTTEAGNTAGNTNSGSISSAITGNAVTKTISGSLQVAGVNYADLDANATIKADFVPACQTTVATAAQTDPANVAITLSQGSVKVDYEITVLEAEATRKTNLLTTAVGSSGTLLADLVSALEDVPGISSVTSGTMTVTSITAPTEMTSVATSKAAIGTNSVCTTAFLIVAAS